MVLKKVGCSSTRPGLPLGSAARLRWGTKSVKQPAMCRDQGHVSGF